MKVKRNPKEETAFEKRNTAITIFILIALLPLLCMLLLGFNMGKADKVNNKKLFAQLDSLRNAHNTLKGNIKRVNTFFGDIDTLRTSYQKSMGRLESDLIAIKEDEEGILMRKWEREYRKKDQYYEEEFIDATTKKIKEPLLAPIFQKGKLWVEDMITAKQDELFTKKLKQKQTVGADIIDDLNNRIKELEGDLLLKQTLLISLQSQMGQSQGNSQIQIDNSDEDKKIIQDKYDKVLANNLKLKESIDIDLDDIKEEILPALRRGVFNGNEFTTLKDRLENKVNNISIKLGELKTED